MEKLLLVLALFSFCVGVINVEMYVIESTTTYFSGH